MVGPGGQCGGVRLINSCPLNAVQATGRSHRAALRLISQPPCALDLLLCLPGTSLSCLQFGQIYALPSGSFCFCLNLGQARLGLRRLQLGFLRPTNCDVSLALNGRGSALRVVPACLGDLDRFLEAGCGASGLPQHPPHLCQIGLCGVPLSH